jgi:alpha/beta superfamily hydrolase
MANAPRRFSFAGPAGAVEAALEEPEQDAGRACAIVCHPHPLFQGTMQNVVVVHCARGLNDAGLPALRFNFRGVGKSEGVHAEGIGEQDDVRAALAEIRKLYPGRPVLLAGYSFGSAVGFAVGDRDPGVPCLIGIGLPVVRETMVPLASSRPALLIQGDRDEYGPVAGVQSFAARCAGKVQVRILADCDHFFVGHLPEVRAAVTEFARAQFASNVDQ